MAARAPNVRNTGLAALSSRVLEWPAIGDMTTSELFFYAAAVAGSLYLAAKITRAILAYSFPRNFPGQANTALLASPRPSVGTKSAEASDLANVREYDYIICGTGTAGSVLAARLSEDPNVSVLAIEAGQSDLKYLLARIPAAGSQLWRTAAAWDLRTVPQTDCKDREMFWPRGRMLGGSSAINAMIYNKGPPDDYDEWERLGNKGWSFAEVEPYLKKAECYHGDKSRLSAEELATHGLNGPWQVGYTTMPPLLDTMIDASVPFGFKKIRDFNSHAGTNGVGQFQTFIDNKGQRSSASAAYFSGEVQHRPNLSIAVGQVVTKIITSVTNGKPRAVGVEMATNALSPVRYLAKARKEVIVCNGAVHSPHLLKLSGIGPAKELARHGIPLVKDLPAVGENLSDHLSLWNPFKVPAGRTSQHRITSKVALITGMSEWLRSGTGPLTDNMAGAAAFGRSVDLPNVPEVLKKNDLSSGPTASDIELLLESFTLYDHGAISPPPGSYASIATILLRPSSRGTITLKSNNPFENPLIDPKYLSTQHDRDFIVWSSKLAREIMQSPGLAKDFEGFGWPIENLGTASDEEILNFARQYIETLYHPMGTVSMGSSPTTSAVDSRLRVHGVDGLRVCDASIFPTPVSAHPCAYVIGVAERAADLIKADGRAK